MHVAEEARRSRGRRHRSVTRARARLRRVRAERDRAAAATALERLNATARGEDNLLPAILDAVRAYATLGEICGELRKVWGEYRPPTVV